MRPRMTIGAGRQRTFLPGNREQIDQSHRRAMGISLGDEEVKELELAVSIYELGSHFTGDFFYPDSYNVDFGADLSEWRMKIKESNAVLESRNWARARKHI